MRSLLHMNGYRLLCGKSTYILLLAAFLFAMFSARMTWDDVESMRNGDNQEIDIPSDGDKLLLEEETMSFNMGVYVNTPVGEQPVCTYLAANLQSGILMVFLTFFVAIFVHAEEASGFVKNIARTHGGKWKVTAAKLVTVWGFAFVLLLTFCAGFCLIGAIFYTDTAFGFGSAFFRYCLLHYFLVCAFASVLFFLTTAARSSIAPMIVGNLAVLGMTTMLVALYNVLTGDRTRTLTKYLLTGSVNRVFIDSNQETILLAIAVGAVWMTVSIAATFFVTGRRDVV